MPPSKSPRAATRPATIGRAFSQQLARQLAKSGRCSRREAELWVRDGRVTVDDVRCTDPLRCVTAHARLAVDGVPITAAARVYWMLNKPRGLLTTRWDDQGRDTVFRCFAVEFLQQHSALAPVGRLDQASEGLLLFTNDSVWAAAILDPQGHCEKMYRVQVSPPPSPAQWQALVDGVTVDGDRLTARRVTVIRANAVTAWLDIALGEGKNRQIRRMTGAVGLTVRRLIRIAIGPLALGELPKGTARALTPAERDALGPSRAAPTTN